MASTAKHWIDPTFLAPNVVEVDVDPVLMEGLQPFVEEIQAGPLAPGDVTLQGLRFFHRTKRKWRSDVGWISAADERCYACSRTCSTGWAWPKSSRLASTATARSGSTRASS